MLLQQYKLKFDDGRVQLARIGQLVYPNNDSEEVIGFISSIDNNEVVITLFDQRDIPLDEFGGVLVTEKMTEAELDAQLYTTVKAADPKIRKMWLDIAEEAEIEQEAQS